MKDYQQDFIEFAITTEVLRFGEFTLKSGRISPYFFNAGLFNNGASLGRLGDFYAAAIRASGEEPDVLYGPAYKGIPLVSSTAIALSRLRGTPVPYCFNRKEAKHHGEGGVTVGAPLEGRVAIVDDVITAGTSIAESVSIIRAAGAVPAAVFIALDREERGIESDASAVTEVSQRFQLPVVAIATLSDIMQYLVQRGGADEQFEAMRRYRAEYGVR